MKKPRDILKELRAAPAVLSNINPPIDRLLREAVDEIERLHFQLERANRIVGWMMPYIGTMCPPSRYRKKPVEIDAFRFEPVFGQYSVMAKDAPIWFLQAEDERKAKIWTDDEEPYCMIDTLEGRMKAIPGDWIIRGTEGELYPCKPSVFEREYERVD